MPLLLNAMTAVFDETGRLALDAKVHVYNGGTTEPAEIYLDSGFGNPAENPFPTDFGMLPALYAPAGTYRLYSVDSSGAVLRDFPAEVVAASVGGGGGGGDAVGFVTGDWKFRYSSVAHAGYVRANGQSIGSGDSNASQRANDDTEDLFVFLYEADPNLAVSGGRGANAAADFAANKSIATPDCRFRVPRGLDTMGAPAAGRATGGNFAFGSGAILGSYGGTATSTLVQSNLPSHSHNVTVTVQNDGTHAHTASAAANGGHTPSGNVTLPNHSHTYQTATLKNVTTGTGSGLSQLWAGPNDAVSTGNDGGGTFSLNMNAVNDHSHPITVNASGAHTHTATATCSNVGSGTGFSILAPFILGTWYIKL